MLAERGTNERDELMSREGDPRRGVLKDRLQSEEERVTARRVVTILGEDVGSAGGVEKRFEDCFERLSVLEMRREGERVRVCRAGEQKEEDQVSLLAWG